jgi:hypothetical protein
VERDRGVTHGPVAARITMPAKTSGTIGEAPPSPDVEPLSVAGPVSPDPGRGTLLRGGLGGGRGTALDRFSVAACVRGRRERRAGARDRDRHRQGERCAEDEESGSHTPEIPSQPLERPSMSRQPEYQVADTRPAGRFSTAFRLATNSGRRQS